MSCRTLAGFVIVCRDSKMTISGLGTIRCDRYLTGNLDTTLNVRLHFSCQARVNAAPRNGDALPGQLLTPRDPYVEEQCLGAWMYYATLP